MNDFVIENGVLKRYQGPDGDVVLPEEVTGMDAEAFDGCVSVTSITIPGELTVVGDSIFDDKGLRKIVAPQTPIYFWKKEGRMLSALRGYLEQGERYAPPILEEYEAWIAQREKLLPMIFHVDGVRGVMAFANHGKITAENFEEDFFQQAQRANATACVAFLLEWKNRHLGQTEIQRLFAL